MLPAVATALFFAATALFAHRAARLLGSTRANVWRLIIAVVVLGTWTHIRDQAGNDTSFGWFFLGGVIGLGVGGLAMFESLPRLGSNLSTLIVQCLAAVAAAAVEWVWLGTRLRTVVIVFATLTLTGVIIGLLPKSLPPLPVGTAASGIAWAVCSALAQGIGAVASRKAFAVAALAHEAVDAGTAAYERALGGLLFASGALAVVLWRSWEVCAPQQRNALSWVMLNALTGPILGVTCYQWALRTTPAGTVQPIVAAAPLLTIPLAARLEHSWPRPLYFVGAALAVVGVAGLLTHH